MSLLPMPRLWTPAYPSARLFVYVSSTTTKQDSFTTKLLNVAHTNPVEADLAGIFPTIHLDPALAYKFVLASAGTDDPPASPLYTVDDYSVSAPGALTLVTTGVNATIAATDGDDILVMADASLGSITITMYSAIGNAGKKLRVVKTDSSNNTVTLDAAGTQTIDGATTRVLTTPTDAINIVADGTNWLSIGRGAFTRIVSLAASGSISATAGDDTLALVSAVAASVTVSLPTAVGAIGRRIRVKRTDATVANTVTVDASGSETIDGGLTLTLRRQYAFIDLVSDGTNWHAVGGTPRGITASPAIVAGVLTLNLAIAEVFLVALDANITSVVVTAPEESGVESHGTVRLTANGSQKTIALGAAHKLPGGITITPTATNAKADILTFFSVDGGTTYYWFISGQNF